MLADLAMKLFFYYHGYCTQAEDQMRLRKPKASPEISAKKLFSVSPTKDKVYTETCYITVGLIF